jgi:hypothetical protein
MSDKAKWSKTYEAFGCAFRVPHTQNEFFCVLAKDESQAETIYRAMFTDDGMNPDEPFNPAMGRKVKATIEEL